MKSMDGLKKKIKTLSSMLKAYNEMKLLAIVKMKQFMTKKKNIVSYLQRIVDFKNACGIKDKKV